MFLSREYTILLDAKRLGSYGRVSAGNEAKSVGTQYNFILDFTGIIYVPWWPLTPLLSCAVRCGRERIDRYLLTATDSIQRRSGCPAILRYSADLYAIPGIKPLWAWMRMRILSSKFPFREDFIGGSDFHGTIPTWDRHHRIWPRYHLNSPKFAPSPEGLPICLLCHFQFLLAEPIWSI